VLLLSFVFTVFIVGTENAGATSVVDAGTVCHTITSKTMFTSTKYGSPINLFDTTNEPLMRVLCTSEKAAMLHVGNGLSTQYIYKYGYQKVNGEWKKVQLTGEKTAGEWLVGSAQAEITGIEEGETGKVVAYVCQKVNGQWKCGCSDEKCSTHRWQAQEFRSGLHSDDVDTGDTSSEELDIHYPSAYFVLPGDTVVLSGAGFDKNARNAVLWNGDVQESGISSETGAELAITVPDLSPGKYEISVTKGSEVSKYSTYIWIKTGEDVSAPTISSISPEEGAQGSEFTIHGEGFTDNNDLITTFGVITGLSSVNGTTISFEYDPFDEELETYSENPDTGKAERYEYSLPVNVSVVNTSGRSNMEIFKLSI